MRIPDERYEVTEKLDGISCTIYLNNGEFGVCSRNIDLLEGDNFYWDIARKYNLKEKIELFNNIAIQGEIVGPEIQGNPLQLHEKDFYVFDIWDINKREYLSSKIRQYICAVLELKHVPIIQYNDVFNFETIEAAIEYASTRSQFINVMMEGLVYKSSTGFSFKVLSNEYLLKNEQ